MVGRCLLLSHRVSKAFIGKPFGNFVARMMRRYQRFFYGCEISRHAIFEGRVRFPHPHGIVIGAGAVIGDGATIYQNVTIGGANPKTKQFSRIGAGATIYPHSVIINQSHIGDGATVGAMSLVRDSVLAGDTVAGVPAKPTRGCHH